ncbi:MAG: DKNYY domain-containing protein [Burkholderiaceae bacterium]
MLFRSSLILTLLLAVVGIAACDSSDYQKSGGQWAHGDTRFTPQDPASFKALDEVFARDATRGYYRGSVVAESDGASFVVISENEARDKNHVYWCDTYRKGQEYWSIKHLRIDRIEGAHPATYRSLGKGYARDQQRVYANGVPFKVRDTATFEPLGGDFAHDAQRGYYARIEIPSSHGPSFETIDARDAAYARDRANGYYGYRDVDTLREANAGPRDRVRTLRGVEPANLRVLGRGYAADTRQVWHRGQPLAGADAASFAVDESYQGPADANDKSSGWNDGKRMLASK